MKNRTELREELTAYRRRLSGLSWVRGAFCAVIACGGTLSLPWMLHIEGDWVGYTNSVLSLAVFILFFRLTRMALRRGFSGKRGRWFWPGCFGFLFALAMVFGAQLDLRGSVPFHRAGMWAAVLMLAVFFALMTRLVWEGLGERKDRGSAERGREEGHLGETETVKARKSGFHSFLTAAGVIWLCYLIVFLAVYPGFFVYDAQDEYMQVLTRNFSTHHPLFHVLFLGGIVHFFYKLTGSYNLGIACYTVIQMTVMSFIFGGCVQKLKREGMKSGWSTLLTLYFGLCPVLVMFSLCSAKDGLFAGMLLIMVLLLRELFEDPGAFFRHKWSVLLLAAASLGMMLLRHNGFYAFAVFAVTGVLCLKGYRRESALCFGAVILLYLFLNRGMAVMLHADSGENQEILTVPISQMARVYGDEKDVLAQEDQEVLYRYLSQEALSHYTPKVSDGVKIHFDNEAFRADKGGFFRLWLKWGAEHPFTYLNAWFMTSYGFWYPDTVIDVYRGNTVFTYTYEDSSYFGYEVEQPGTRESKIPWLDELYRRMSLEITQQRIPVVSMLFSPGFLFWMTTFWAGFLCYQRRWRRAAPFALPLLVWLTVILGPTYLVRYVVFLWTIEPVLLFTALECE